MILARRPFGRTHVAPSSFRRYAIIPSYLDAGRGLEGGGELLVGRLRAYIDLVLSTVFSFEKFGKIVGGLHEPVEVEEFDRVADGRVPEELRRSPSGLDLDPVEKVWVFLETLPKVRLALRGPRFDPTTTKERGDDVVEPAHDPVPVDRRFFQASTLPPGGG